MPSHVGQFLYQPILTIVVIEYQYAIVGQTRPRRRKCILSQQKTLEAQARVTRSEGKRIGQSKDNQVIVLGRVLQKVAPIIDDNFHSRVAVGMVGVIDR